MNYLDISTDLPLWLLLLIHDAVVFIANLTGHKVVIVGPLDAHQAEEFHEQIA